MANITYQQGLENIHPHQLRRLRSEWVKRPAPALTLASLRNMVSVIALDEHDDVIGFAGGLTDGLLILYVWDVEVIEAHRGLGVEAELVGRLLERHGHVYQINAHPGVVMRGTFEAFGLVAYDRADATAMTRIDRTLQDGGVAMA